MPTLHSPIRQELLDALLEQATHHAIILLDAGGHVVSWLGAAERMFGHTAAEMAGQTLDRLFTPEDTARGIPQLEVETALRKGYSENDRWQQRKDGARIYVVGVLVSLHGPQGELLGFGKIMRNLTDHRIAFESLQNQVEGLRSADDRKTVFLGTLGHEIRNHLAPLVNSVELIRRMAAIAPEAEFTVTIMEQQLDAVRRLVDDLLDLTRIAAGKVELKTQRIRVRDVLRDAIETCRPQFGKQRQHFETVFAPKPIEIEGDPIRLQQVFVNLLSNASKYTPAGGTIWLSESIEENEAVVRVKDDGIGISPELLPRIFELFAQEAGSAGSGLGIGLSLVKTFVTLHRGQVLVRSNGKGQGSEFTVRLPLAPPNHNGRLSK
jgi:two-component system CheB/CheR fusion protein